jgi:hypothetical protein
MRFGRVQASRGLGLHTTHLFCTFICIFKASLGLGLEKYPRRFVCFLFCVQASLGGSACTPRHF